MIKIIKSGMRKYSVLRLYVILQLFSYVTCEHIYAQNVPTHEINKPQDEIKEDGTEEDLDENEELEDVSQEEADEESNGETAKAKIRVEKIFPSRDIFGILMENDLWGFIHTDKAYTNGIRLRFCNRQLECGIEKSLLLAPFMEQENSRVDVISEIGQNMYTPDDITIESVDSLRDRRPYAAYLFIGNHYTIQNSSESFYHKSMIGVQVGVMGRKALGKEAQTFIHKYISHSPPPMGWHTQIIDRYAIQTYWIGEKTIYEKRYLDLSMQNGVYVGNVYINVNSRFIVRAGLFGTAEITQDQGVKLDKDTKAENVDLTIIDPFKLYAIISWTPYLVFHNATITGKPFAGNPVTQQLPYYPLFMNDYQIGVGTGMYICDVGEFLFEWKHNWRTVEYRTKQFKVIQLLEPQHNFGSYQFILRKPF